MACRKVFLYICPPLLSRCFDMNQMSACECTLTHFFSCTQRVMASAVFHFGIGVGCPTGVSS